MHPYKFNVSLRLTHPTQDLGEIYNKLGALPDAIPRRIWKAGDERLGQKGGVLEGKYEKSYCYFDFFKEPRKSDQISLSNALEKIAEDLSIFKSDIERHVDSGEDAEFFVGMYIDSNCSEIFSPELMGKLADSRVKLSLDIYPPDKE